MKSESPEPKIRASLAVIALFLLTGSANAEKATGTFGKYRFTLQLPSGYALTDEASPSPALKTFGFATDLRQDGTRGLVQVTLISLEDVTAVTPVTLSAFAESMIAGVRRRRANWKATNSEVLMAGTNTVRMRWSGTAATLSAIPTSRPMHGVMIVGIRGGLGFSLHTQDAEPWSAAELPKCEKALMTFKLASLE